MRYVTAVANAWKKTVAQRGRAGVVAGGRGAPGPRRGDRRIAFGSPTG